MSSHAYMRLFLPMLSPWMADAPSSAEQGTVSLLYATTVNQIVELLEVIIAKTQRASPIEEDDWCDRSWLSRVSE